MKIPVTVYETVLVDDSVCTTCLISHTRDSVLQNIGGQLYKVYEI